MSAIWVARRMFMPPMCADVTLTFPACTHSAPPRTWAVRPWKGLQIQFLTISNVTFRVVEAPQSVVIAAVTSTVPTEYFRVLGQ